MNTLEQTYARGQCASLALAVLEHLKLPCVVFYNTDPDNDYAVHVANQVDGGYLDICGVVSQAEMEDRYGLKVSSIFDPEGEDTMVQFEVCMSEWGESEEDPYGAQRAWKDCSAVMLAHLVRHEAAAANVKSNHGVKLC